ncbi:hypothetical protein ACQKJG_18415 [Priestia megaterium]|uniref:hypothetical protein n=1 Tax=Priestia megaterium TaxID=1404 RepID=UPI003CFF9FEF
MAIKRAWKMKLMQVGTHRTWEEEILQKTDQGEYERIPETSSEEKALELAEQTIDGFNRKKRSDERQRKVITVFLEELR